MPKYTKVKVLVPKIKTHQLSSFTELHCRYCCPIKSLAATGLPEYVATHSLPTAPLRTRQFHAVVPQSEKLAVLHVAFNGWWHLQGWTSGTQVAAWGGGLKCETTWLRLTAIPATFPHLLVVALLLIRISVPKNVPLVFLLCGVLLLF